MNLSSLTLILSALFYALAFLFHLLSFLEIRKAGGRTAFGLMRVGFLFSTFYFVSQTIDSRAFLPVASFSEAMAFFAWALAFVYLVFLIRIQTESFGLVLTPILAVFLIVAILTVSQTAQVRLPNWQLEMNPYFKLHIMSAFFAYASFTVSFSAGLLYLVQHHELKTKKAGTFYQRLPSLEELEQLIYRPLLWGVPLLVVAIVVGFLWSKSAYGEFWFWDPKTLASLITVCLYLVILYLHYVATVRGKQVALLSLFTFGLVMLSFVGMRFVGGSHNYLQ